MVNDTCPKATNSLDGLQELTGVCSHTIKSWAGLQDTSPTCINALKNEAATCGKHCCSTGLLCFGFFSKRDDRQSLKWSVFVVTMRSIPVRFHLVVLPPFNLCSSACHPNCPGG